MVALGTLMAGDQLKVSYTEYAFKLLEKAWETLPYRYEARGVLLCTLNIVSQAA